MNKGFVYSLQGFSTVDGNVLVFRPIHSSGRTTVVIRDGVTIDSPVLFSGRVGDGRYAQYILLPSVVTSGNGITIELLWSLQGVLLFELRSGLKGEHNVIYYADASDHTYKCNRNCKLVNN